jgi:hypothetical protein
MYPRREIVNPVDGIQIVEDNDMQKVKLNKLIEPELAGRTEGLAEQLSTMLKTPWMPTTVKSLTTRRE